MREIQSLARGLQILDILTNSQTPVGVTELAQILDVDKSTASRLVNTLQMYGYVQQDHNSRAYIPGKRLHSIGLQLTNRFSLREQAKPYLYELVQETGECAHIAVYESGKALVTDDIQPEHSLLRVVSSQGRLIHLHNTAVGKGLIAFGDFPLPTHLPRYTARTITTQEMLKHALLEVREKGYAVDDEENEPGVRCIASPVFDAVGTTVATIGISGPTVRVVTDDVESIGKTVRNAGCRLSRSLGYQGEYPKNVNGI